jgi:hypothetical protein
MDWRDDRRLSVTVSPILNRGTPAADAARYCTAVSHHMPS